MTIDSITIQSPAKINWMLRIGGKRPDGFHDLETVFQTISLADRLTFVRGDRTSLACDAEGVPSDSTNLVWRAWEMLAQRHGVGPVEISLAKTIPAQGGLGGGSSNAAAALVALDEMFGLDLGREVLARHALELGSDVPFFLRGGTAWGGGRGEILESIASAAGIPLALVLPEEKMSTAEAFRALGRGDQAPAPIEGPASWDEHFESGVLSNPHLLSNDFEVVFFERFPHLQHARSALLESGAEVAMLCGSGSTIFGAYRDEVTRNRAVEALAKTMRVIAATTTGK